MFAFAVCLCNCTCLHTMQSQYFFYNSPEHFASCHLVVRQSGVGSPHTSSFTPHLIFCHGLHLFCINPSNHHIGFDLEILAFQDCNMLKVGKKKRTLERNVKRHISVIVLIDWAFCFDRVIFDFALIYLSAQQ